MNCSIQREYEFPVDGSVSVPRDTFSYAGCTLYERSGDSYSPVYLPGDLYTGVPSRVDYHDECRVTLYVDGTPFERSVDRCSDEVDTLHSGVDALTDKVENLNGGIQNLTGGVGTLTSSTVMAATGITAAKVASAETISNSLSRGFSKYIGYLIREKLTEIKAKLPNTASTFKALGDSLNKRRDVLGRDYERISDRYSKLFVKLNDELKGRLLELDRPVFENCAQMQAAIFTDPFNESLGQSVCASTEQLQTADAVRVSRLKESTAVAMELIRDYLKVIQKLSASVSGTLTDRKVTDTQSHSMPVVRMECDNFVAPQKDVRTFIPQWFESNREMGFGEKISEAFRKEETKRKSQEELEMVEVCFKQRCSNWAASTKSGMVDPRVTAKILMLWEQSKAKMFN